jgi:hypothetical protein
MTPNQLRRWLHRAEVLTGDVQAVRRGRYGHPGGAVATTDSEMTWDALMATAAASTRVVVAWAAVQAALLVAAWDLTGWLWTQGIER